ncbi:MAG: plasmid pRiA4b ORF-3 family protein [Coriobacteriales bacterium]|nr:plasmid pRiA4b ORF-3 family protein [Coriobacteriales bacterium]
MSFNFEVLLCGRTLLVPEHTTFEDFHTMIQACFNWLNYHLYNFVLKGPKGEVCISWPDYDTGEDPRLEYYLEGEQLSPWVNAQTSYLDDYFPATREATYSYDYGDGWEIKIRLINQGEKIASDNPLCTRGNGDAPPEDVGGEGGFLDFIAITKNPEDEEYASTCAWAESQGFEHFSQPLTNKRLSHWKDWARGDVDMMGYTAQMKAFGKILVEPGQSLTTENNSLLIMFEKHLSDSGLHPRTVQNHLDNVYFFLDEYLMRRRTSAVDGLHSVEDYLGNWLINTYESSKTFLKNCASSLNKFYQWMASCGYVDSEEQKRVQRNVRAHLSEWAAEIPPYR